MLRTYRLLTHKYHFRNLRQVLDHLKQLPWTPRFLIDYLKQKSYEWSHPLSPWFTPEMINILKCWLRPDDLGLEWGSGRSTLWFGKRVAHLISIEHDPDWAKIVLEELIFSRLFERVNYIIIPAYATDQADSEYVQIATKIEPNSLDFCIIDGIIRDHCALACLNIIKPGGILIIDDMHRYFPKNPKSRSRLSHRCIGDYASENWKKFSQIVKGWHCVWTSNGLFDTVLWVKPFNSVSQRKYFKKN